MHQPVEYGVFDRESDLNLTLVNFTVKIAVCMSLQRAAYGELDCHFAVDSQEWGCSKSSSKCASDSPIHSHFYSLLQMEDSDIRRFDCDFSFHSYEWSCRNSDTVPIESKLCHHSGRAGPISGEFETVICIYAFTINSSVLSQLTQCDQLTQCALTHHPVHPLYILHVVWDP